MGRRQHTPSETDYDHVVTRGNRRTPGFQQTDDYRTDCILLQDAT